MISKLHHLLMAGLLCFPTLAFGDAHQRADDVIDCLNLQSRENEELRISNTAGPIARVLEQDDFHNVCTAESYFCIVSTEVSWMFTWNAVLKVSDDRIAAFDLWPGSVSHNYVYIPEYLVQALLKCDVQWEGHWVGEPLFLEPQSDHLPDVLNEGASPSLNIAVDDLLPPPAMEQRPTSE